MDIAFGIGISCVVGNLLYSWISRRPFFKNKPSLSYGNALQISLFQIFAIWITAFALIHRYERIEQPITGTQTEISETGVLTFHFQKYDGKVLTCEGHRGGVEKADFCNNPGELR